MPAEVIPRAESSASSASTPTDAGKRVVPDHADGKRLAAERSDVRNRVRAAAGDEAFGLVAKNEYGCLPADALRSAGEEAIEHQVGEHQDRLAGESIGKGEKALGAGEWGRGAHGAGSLARASRRLGA